LKPDTPMTVEGEPSLNKVIVKGNGFEVAMSPEQAIAFGLEVRRFALEVQHGYARLCEFQAKKETHEQDKMANKTKALEGLFA